MIDRILGYISKLQLSFEQIAILAVVTVISGLVAALKIQGSALHKAQIQLLSQRIQNTDQSDDAAVAAARAAFNKEYYAYCKAKKEIGDE